jgi:hypothetical protein
MTSKCLFKHGQLQQQQKNPRFHRDTASHHTQHTSRPKQHQQPRQTAMPTDNLADAFQLGPEIPIRPRNPYRRGTPKHLKRQNINRNVRLHLRNDRKNVQEKFNNSKQLQETHFVFYSTLTEFEMWNHTRQFLPRCHPHSSMDTGISQGEKGYPSHGQIAWNTMRPSDVQITGAARKALFAPLNPALLSADPSHCLIRGKLHSTKNAWIISAHISMHSSWTPWLLRIYSGCCQPSVLWRYYLRHLTGCRRNFVCHGLILIVTTLVGGSLTYKSTRLDAKTIYRYRMHTYQYLLLENQIVKPLLKVEDTCC